MITASIWQQLREEGFCIVPEVLNGETLAEGRAALDRAAENSSHDERLDPNDRNIRVYNLPAKDAVFVELLRHPIARAIVAEVLGPNFLVSNFTANIALPGSQSMRTHSDQALVIPAPWNEPWAINIIWCLDDVHAANGATLYAPGSHHYRSFEDVPADIDTRLRAFEAPAGSLIAMEGRLWHTSGANVTRDEQRRMMFAYYGMDFIRPQVNWEAVLPQRVKDGLDDDARRLLGLGGSANTRIGGALTRLQPA
jgi:fumagillin biosynthesis dioxygenase